MPRTPEDAPTDADALIRVGVVSSVDLAGGTCTVMLDDGDGAESPPIRWLYPRMGATKAWLPPSTGEQGLVLCPGGELGAAVFVGGLHSAPFPAPSDEPVALIRFSDGAAMAYDPLSHELLLQLPSGATTVLVSDGGVDIVGDVNLTGKLIASDDVIADGKSLKTHKHNGVQAGSAQTGAPV